MRQKLHTDITLIFNELYQVAIYRSRLLLAEFLPRRRACCFAMRYTSDNCYPYASQIHAKRRPIARRHDYSLIADAGFLGHIYGARAGFSLTIAAFTTSAAAPPPAMPPRRADEATLRRCSRG